MRPVDCLSSDGLPSLPDASVSLVLTDPPYFIDGMDDGWDNQQLDARFHPSSSVSGLPAVQAFDRQQGERLQAFMTPVAEQVMRVLKPGGFLLCFSQARLHHRTAMAFDLAGFEVRDMLGWVHNSGQPKAFSMGYRVRQMGLPPGEEQQLLDTLGGRKTPQLKPQFEPIVMAQKPRDGTFVANWLAHQTGLIDVSDPVLDPGRFPGQLLAAPKPKERHNHRTPKPVDVCRHLIKVFTAPGALVCDPFTGSGTTGVAALTTPGGARPFVGFEIDPVTAAGAESRIAETAAETSEAAATG